MKTKRILAAVSAFLAAATLSGCISNTETAPGTTEDAEVTTEDSAPVASAATEEAETNENAAAEEAGTPSPDSEDGSASSAEQAASEDQQTGNIFDEYLTGGFFAEKTVEFTEADIEAIRGIFDPSDGFFKLLFADTPFDFSQDITDLNQILKFVNNWQNVILTDIQADDQYAEYSELLGEDMYLNLFKPETIESVIREKLIPDFDISGFDLSENTVYWNEERQMFSSIDLFIPEGYSGHFYEIVSDGQEGEYYCITVISIDNVAYFSMSEADFAKYYASLPRQKYTFRKLPNGNIAPLRMELTQPEEVDNCCGNSGEDF